ncbi:MAG: hypothetical protein B0W54_08195 [Cellvibrio sp. 79]|nr:MAG: hypothetical protein B0W54_08195 [Cellvibrio sp. 79]
MRLRRELFIACCLIAIGIGPINCLANSQSSKISSKIFQGCELSAIEKSHASIQFLLNDIKSTYPHTGGAGISEIKQTQTNVFVVSINQEERIDQLTYELSIDESCQVKLVKKEESAINFSR